MFKLARLTMFAVTCLIGIAASETVNLPPLQSWFCECSSWGDSDRQWNLFSLSEMKEKMNLEVEYVGETTHRRTGRTVAFEMVKSDKFFVVVYWDETPETGKPGVRYYDKDGYASLVRDKERYE